MKRRDFLRRGPVGMLGIALLTGAGAGCVLPSARRLALQLYSVRDALEKDLEGTLQRLSGMGFTHVETAFWPKGVSLERASAAVQRAGLSACSCHIELPVGDARAAFIETAHAFGCTDMVWHGWPEDARYARPEGVRELLGIYDDSAAFARENGLRLGLHNHWWEFMRLVDGRPSMEWILRNCDPSIFFELDTYWLKVAGYDPAQVVRRFGARARYLHIKDGPARWSDRLGKDEPEPMTAVGKGAQDMPAILHASGYVEGLIIEMDRVEGDVFEAIRESRRYLLAYA